MPTLAPFVALVALLAQARALPAAVNVDADVDARVGNLLDVNAKADASVGRDGIKVDVCATGHVLDAITLQCERSSGRDYHSGPYRPNNGVCPSGWRRHPTLLDLCVEAAIDVEADLCISGPHRDWISDSNCVAGWKAHPSILGVCVQAGVNYNLDLGHYGRRPDWLGSCPSGWRKHPSILNLCLDTDIEIVLLEQYKGRHYLSDGHCTAGWRAHPHVADLCVDVDVDLSLFNNDRQAFANGSCPNGYYRHASILNLCLLANVQLGLGGLLNGGAKVVAGLGIGK